MNRVHVISWKRLREFVEHHPDAERPLRHWFDVAEDARWRSLVEVREAFAHADAVQVSSGRTVTVFNVAGNKYRLVTAIHYNRQKAHTLMVLTHAEYNRQRWKEHL